MITDAQAKTIQERAARAASGDLVFAGALAEGLLNVAHFRATEADDANVRFAVHARTDIPDLLADRRERTELLREVRGFVIHLSGCGSVWTGINQSAPPCDCGLDALLARIEEAVK